MTRLAFGYYRALHAYVETFDTQFWQLERDYQREIRGQSLVFAVDFSELHDIIHSAEKSAERAEINKYVLTSLDDRFTLLPGAVAELMADLERTVAPRLKQEMRSALYSSPAVSKFLQAFSSRLGSEEYLIGLYAAAEAELRSALGEVLNVVVSGHVSSAFLDLKSLLETKLSPIVGLQRVPPLGPQEKNLSRLVESHLSASRPDLPESNRIDALDYSIARALNQQAGTTGDRYVTIYTQATHFIEACRSHVGLQWDEEYMTRELSYFRIRTKLGEMRPGVDSRLSQVREWRRMCKAVKAELGNLVDIEDRLGEGGTESSLELVALMATFDAACATPLSIKSGWPQTQPPVDRAKKLYDVLKDQGRFDGSVEDAYAVLREQMRDVQRRLKAFAPADVDTGSARAYKAAILEWLDEQGSRTI